MASSVRRKLLKASASLSQNNLNNQVQMVLHDCCHTCASFANRVKKKGSEVTVAAHEKITDLQEHARNVETLLNSMQASN